MIIKLITSDFKGSAYCRPEDCPLARALRRYFPNDSISVGGRFIYINDTRYHWVGNWNPDSRAGIIGIKQMIYDADAGKEVSYELDIPDLNL